MAAAMSVPPVHVSVMAPPRMMPSSPLIAFSGQPTAENDSRPWTVGLLMHGGQPRRLRRTLRQPAMDGAAFLADHRVHELVDRAGVQVRLVALVHRIAEGQQFQFLPRASRWRSRRRARRGVSPASHGKAAGGGPNGEAASGGGSGSGSSTGGVPEGVSSKMSGSATVLTPCRPRDDGGARPRRPPNAATAAHKPDHASTRRQDGRARRTGRQRRHRGS